DIDSYNKALKTISAYILKNSGTYYDVNEILHNAIEVYFTKKLKGKIIPGAGELTLICRISERMWKDELKKRKKRPPALPLTDDLEDTQASELEMKKRKEAFFEKMEEKIQAMKEPCRTIILRIVSGESYESMVEDMESIDLVNLRKRYYRCKEILRNMMKVSENLKELS
ncbi:MAG: hypothetical protein IH594_11670, partial [Bacteroidales bacterium]|nr:hypothetical protein [Bacteroidales bacterium]